MFPSDKIMDRQEMQVKETISEMIDLMRDGFFSDMTIVCKGGTVETNSILFSTLFPVVGPILENTRAYDNTYVLLIPEIDSNHLVEFLMNVLLKSPFVQAHPSIVNLLKPIISNPGKNYQENIKEPEKPLTTVCINFVEPKKETTSQCFLDDPTIQAEDIKNEEMDDELEDLDPMDASDDVAPDSPVEQRMSQDREEFCCSLCGTLCKSKKILKRHALICKGDKFPFKCSECGSGFKYERGLVRHYKEDHAIARPHKCKHCGKAFKRKFCLRNHEKTHEEKQYKCEYCDKLFNYLGNMKKHIARMHEESTQAPQEAIEGPRVLCQECGKSFKEKSYLEMHQKRSHLKVKSLKCDFEGCNEKFVYSLSKYRHEEKVHGIIKTYKKTVKCRFGCETEYKDVRQRNNHEVSIHGRKGKRLFYGRKGN